jgi:hypothetical protein
MYIFMSIVWNWWLSENLTPAPLQPGALNNTNTLLAGEGSLKERGHSPLSNSLPLSNKGYFENK